MNALHIIDISHGGLFYSLKRKIIHCLVGSTSLLFTNCSDSFDCLFPFDIYCGDSSWEIIPGGLTTTVSGTFSDSNLNIPFANTKAYVEEYVDDPIKGLSFSRYMDSTYTDIDGNYNMRFVTTGVGVQYHVTFRPIGLLYWWNNESFIPYCGGRNVVNVHAARLSILKAKVTVIDNKYRPLRVYTENGNSYDFNKTNDDSTIFLRVLPNRKTAVYFFVTVSDTTHQYVRERVDTIDMLNNLNDTIKAEFVLYPRTFKKRKR